MGLEPKCYVCTPQSCDIFDKCKGKQTEEEGAIAATVAKELDVRQVRAEACKNPWKRVVMLEEVAELRKLSGLQKNSIKKVWHIRYEGCVSNPRFRGFKRRTCSIVTDAEGAKRHAEALERDLGVKVLWIKPKEVKS